MRTLSVSILLLITHHATGTPTDPDTEVARRHFNAGADLYKQQRYEEAIVEFEVTRKLKPHPDLDYNVARCLDRLERWAEAADAYERYLIAGSPTEEEALKVADRVVILRSRTHDIFSSTPLSSSRRDLPPIPHATLSIPLLPDETRATSTRSWRWWVAGSAAVIVSGVSVGLGVGLHENDAYVPIVTTDGHYVARFP